jgi:hypothetical protein
MYPKFKEVLYHGTVSEISKVDVTSGRDRKDFGKGFYLQNMLRLLMLRCLSRRMRNGWILS